MLLRRALEIAPGHAEVAALAAAAPHVVVVAPHIVVVHRERGALRRRFWVLLALLCCAPKLLRDQGDHAAAHPLCMYWLTLVYLVLFFNVYLVLCF